MPRSEQNSKAILAAAQGQPAAVTAPVGTNITPKTLTAASPVIVPALGSGQQGILFQLLIKNTDTVARSVTLGDGTDVFGTFEIEPKGVLAVNHWPLSTAWFGAANAAINATPSADGVLKVASGKYHAQAAS